MEFYKVLDAQFGYQCAEFSPLRPITNDIYRETSVLQEADGGAQQDIDALVRNESSDKGRPHRQLRFTAGAAEISRVVSIFWNDEAFPPHRSWHFLEGVLRPNENCRGISACRAIARKHLESGANVGQPLPLGYSAITKTLRPRYSAVQRPNDKRNTDPCQLLCNETGAGRTERGYPMNNIKFLLAIF